MVPSHSCFVFLISSLPFVLGPADSNKQFVLSSQTCPICVLHTGRCGSIIIFFGSGSYFTFNFGSGTGLFGKHAFIKLNFSFFFVSRIPYSILEIHF